MAQPVRSHDAAVKAIVAANMAMTSSLQAVSITNRIMEGVQQTNVTFSSF